MDERVRNELLRKAHRQLMLKSLRFYTAEMFEILNRTPFIFGEHHLKICKALDDVVKGETRKLIINIAPRYGKTELAVKMFISYGFAVNPASKFLHLSYSGSLTQDNSVTIKDVINTDYYRSLFPTRIAYGKDTKSHWITTEGGGLYATSTLGQITGFGAGATDKENEEELMDEYMVFANPHRFNGAIVIDDPIKPEDALSDNIREVVNRRFETTIRNRVNSRKTPIVIIMQRLHEHDLCGYLQEIEPNEWTVLSLPCLTMTEDNKEHALWEHKHTVEELHKLEQINPFVFETQYQQNPTPMEGLMYGEFKTYTELPFDGIDKCYCDPADVGTDYHCAIFYREHKGYCYVTDVMYTQEDMDKTEPKMAIKLYSNFTKECAIEANGAGRLYAKNVERRCRENGNKVVRFVTFAQTQSKPVRIFSNANAVNNVVLMPEGWERKWPQFHSAVKAFRKVGRNANDDAPDALTGVVERMDKTNKDLEGLFY